MSRAKSRKTIKDKVSGWCVAPSDPSYDLPAHLFKKEDKEDDRDSDA